MKTGEIYTYALSNPEAKFKHVGDCSLGCLVASFNKVGKLVDENGSLVYPRYDMEWELVREPVDFLTAINSEARIKYENWDGYASVGIVLAILANKVQSTALKMINGKWYIEE